MTTANNPVVTAKMIEAGRARLAELTSIILTQGELSAIYLAMTQASPTPDEMVERLRGLIECLLENEPDDLIADGGVTVLDEWRKEARAALKSIGIEDQG